MAWAAGPDAREACNRLLTLVVAGGLAGLGLWALRENGNFTLLLCAGWLLASRGREV